MNAFRTKSFLRREQYRALSELSVDGKILDVGGSKIAGYHELLGGDHVITTGNINAAYGCDVIFDAEKPWPFPDASFDAVLFVNLLEHLYEYRTALAEGRRVLKTGGIVAGVVPFMLNVHGTPSDYFRYTDSALERILGDAGFSDVRIRPLGSGAFGVVYQTLLGFMRWHWLADMAMPVFRGMDRFIGFLKPGNRMSAREMPLGYYFEARKR